MTAIFIQGAPNFDWSETGQQRRASGYETFYHPRTGTSLILSSVLTLARFEQQSFLPCLSAHTVSTLWVCTRALINLMIIH